VIEEIAPERLVAIVRPPDPELAVPLAEAIVSGGISRIEVALTTPRALEAIAEVVSPLAHRAVVGAGNVRNASDAGLTVRTKRLRRLLEQVDGR
jgi:2-keto-3-deoxy-6-phosphogluconate aldolase